MGNAVDLDKQNRVIFQKDNAFAQIRLRSIFSIIKGKMTVYLDVESTVITLIKLYKQEMFRSMIALQALSVVKTEKAQAWAGKVGRIAIPTALASSIYYYHSRSTAVEVFPEWELELPKQEKSGAGWQILRFVELGCIFTPAVLLLPLCLWERTKPFWLQVFLWCVKRAGFVWIKAFQYLSHRADIIGQEMADKFIVLREGSPVHSLQSTEQTIKRMYGKSIEQLFEHFQPEPVASGSVSQVYRARMNGKDVAVKVRHPQAACNLEKDIDLLFLFSRFFSIFSKKFQIPVTTYSLKKILAQQLCFLQEKRNMDYFGTLAVDRDVSFPRTYPQSTDQVLIEEYIDGSTIGYYQTRTHPLNRVIANIGAKAFFSMLMKHNFVHADCHAGNILVRIKEAPSGFANFLSAAGAAIRNLVLVAAMKFGMQPSILQRLASENYEYEKEVHALVQKYKAKVEVVLIDVGMAIRLSQSKKDSFQSFLSEIIQGNSAQCARWIHRISMYDGKLLSDNDHANYLSDLQTMFRRVHQTSLDSLEGIVVLKEMLGVIRAHDMKIDGQISILLTNMLILEAIAKDLDPQINILRCAVPYLHYR